VLRSPRNPRVAAVARLHDARERRRRGLHVAEGERVCGEAFASGAVVELFHVDGSRDLLAQVGADVRVTLVDERVMARLSDAVTPPGVLAVVRTPDTTLPLGAQGSLLVLDGVGDPGNVGTLIRSAAAFGADVVSVGGADPFGPKAVRASAGTCYRTRIHRSDVATALGSVVRGGGRLVLGLAADGDRTLEEAERDIPESGVALVVGSEPDGLSDAVRAELDGLVRIPMAAGVESLNVAAAGAIAMYGLMRR
jgi:RNA methyltransferase, TrmH family